MRTLGVCVTALSIVTMLAATQSYAADKAAAPPVTAELGADGIQRATVTLDSYSFNPAHLIVQAGKPVELTLTNVSTVAPHNLIVDDPASGLAVHQEVASGKSAKVMFTPTKPGSFAFYCGKKLLMFPSHRSKGMEGILEVR